LAFLLQGFNSHLVNGNPPISEPDHSDEWMYTRFIRRHPADHCAGVNISDVQSADWYYSHTHLDYGSIGKTDTALPNGSILGSHIDGRESCQH
jgi:hypothetical protein